MTTIGIYLLNVLDADDRLLATLDGLIRHTPRARIVLLVDDPKPETTEAFRSLYKLPCLSGSARGPAAAFNRLLSCDDAAVLIFLESGTVVTAGWLDRIETALATTFDIGLAGPSTNHAWNEQQLPEAPGFGASNSEIETFVAELAIRYGKALSCLEPLHSLADFAYAVKREVVDAIGAADESYGRGPCWEMDYSIRAARAGFRSIWVRAAYAHRSPLSAARLQDEARLQSASNRRYQDKFCGLRLIGHIDDYEPHCRGDTCEHFAPSSLIPLRTPLSLPIPVVVPALIPAEPVALPLVSCILPTRDRRHFLQQSIHYFQKQNYPARELIIVDDSAKNEAAQIPEDPRIRYVHIQRPESIGAKRNRACMLAHGTYIVQWDDDDWYGPERLRAQVLPLITGEADITGLIAEIFFDLPRWQFWICTPDLHAKMFFGDVHGGTLAFHRNVWEQIARYPDASLAEDAAFLRQAIQHGARLCKLPGKGQFIYLRHGRNVWSFCCGEHVDPRGWLQIEEPLLPIDDRAFYKELAEQASAEGSRAAIKTTSNQPMVSCIMPTSNRRLFVPQAIKYFLRQDYPNRQLVVVDDGSDRIADLVPIDSRIKYVTADCKLSIGEKRNLAVQQSDGTLIAHWDDDDWYHCCYLSRMLDRLLAYNDTGAVAGSGSFLVHILGEPDVRIFRAGGLVGATLCYFRSLWTARPYRNVASAEDFFFLHDGPTTFLSGDDLDLFMVIRHGLHTWTTERGMDVTEQLRHLAHYHKRIDQLMEPEDVAFYDSIPNHGKLSGSPGK
jgi:glycosyltransferase involved in cell wall biosynthesis/GT2 family glycosyltransferase